MAIDTRDKRASVMSMGFYGVLPTPDNAITQGDRQTVGWIYAGIFNVNPPFVGEVDVYFAPERNPLYFAPVANNLFYDPLDVGLYSAPARNPLYFVPTSNPVYYDPDN